jgi:hypothetical protein
LAHFLGPFKKYIKLPREVSQIFPFSQNVPISNLFNSGLAEPEKFFKVLDDDDGLFDVVVGGAVSVATVLADDALENDRKSGFRQLGPNVRVEKLWVFFFVINSTAKVVSFFCLDNICDCVQFSACHYQEPML